MSIHYTLKKEGTTDTILIDFTEITCETLKKEIAAKLKTDEDNLTIMNSITGLSYMPRQLIRDGSTVTVDINIRQKSKDITINEIVSEEQLESMCEGARFFMIKSSNQENIQKARQFSVWATTLSNQNNLKIAYRSSPNVFLIFATNRSYEIKGMARMESQPTVIPDKNFWNGVSNIRLGGNFRIRWIRKKPLNCALIEKSLGVHAKDEIMRLSDGQQADSQVCKKMAKLFEIPTEPQIVIRQQQMVRQEPKIANFSDIMNTSSLPMPGMPGLHAFIPPFMPAQYLASMMEKAKQEKNQKDAVKKKKNKKKKKKSDRKKRAQSSSSDSSSSDSESDSSSRSLKKKKKIKKRQQKAHKKKKSKDKKKKKSKHRQ